MEPDLGVLTLAATAVGALVAVFVVPGWYERHLTRGRRNRILTKMLRMSSGDLPNTPVVSAPTSPRGCGPGPRQVRSFPPDAGLAVVAPKHRRAD
jgi:hypothetical protein